MAKRPAKSETLTIRLDPKTRFMLEFVSRLRGQTITTVVERAISDAANRATLEPDEDYRGNPIEPKSWRDFWSVYEGERALKLAQEPELHPTFDEERRLAFAKYHWQFFYTNPNCINIRSAYVEILWSRIDEFIEIHEQTKTTDFFSAGTAMKNALLAANIAPPDWPPMLSTKEEKETGGGYSRDLDDGEIPF